MSFPRYPKYKDSGVEWLGEVPEHWEVCQTKRRLAARSGGSAIKGRCSNEPADGLFPAFSASGQDVWVEEYMFDTPGVVLSAVGARCGKTFKADGRWSAVANTHCLFPIEHASREFLWYLTNQEDWWETGGTAQPFVKVSETLGRRWAFPPPLEQTAIAAFLDRETAKIDALIAEQQRLIELLQEKRQAVISHAVTKGLNPDAPMKDSGIEWLGEVPEHWECVRNKVVFHEVDDRSETEDGELLTVSHITGVTPRSEKDVNMFMAETFVGYKKCCAGDLVINTMWAWMGALGCAKCDGIVSPSYNVYRPRDHQGLWPDYYDDLCRVPAHRIAIKARSTGIWESRLRLYPDAFLGMSMPLPPFGEQREIAAFVDCQTSQWDLLTAEAKRAITLLQERRSALISAAVTGQIDVRGLAGSEAA